MLVSSSPRDRPWCAAYLPLRGLRLSLFRAGDPSPETETETEMPMVQRNSVRGGRRRRVESVNVSKLGRRRLGTGGRASRPYGKVE